MSTERSSSAVRNLRSIFETKGGEDSPSDARGRPRSGLSSERSNSRPTSSVRASFVAVEPPKMSALVLEEGVGNGTPEGKRRSTADIRRGSFTANSDEGALDLKKTISEEARRREAEHKVDEVIPEAAVESSQNSAAGTPRPQAERFGGDGAVAVTPTPMAQESAKVDKEPANPDKPTTGAEEEPVEMKPAEPANEEAVSGGEALPPVAEDLRRDDRQADATPAQSAKVQGEDAPATKHLESAARSAKKTPAKAPTTSKPSPVSTKAPTEQSPSTSSVKSPASQPKSPLATKSSAKKAATSPTQPTKKPSRSSLTAPTAASMSRTAGQDRTTSTSSKTSTTSKAGHKTTKPIDLPSRLTAPTAASRAKHEPESAPSSRSSAVNGKASNTATKPKPPTSSARPTPRSSLVPNQRAESRTSAPSRKPAAPSEGSFLERMMRPTAASANKTHDKPEVKSPPRANKTTAPPKPKTNGHMKKPAPTTKPSSRPSTAKSASSATEKAAAKQAGDETQTKPQLNGSADGEGEDMVQVAQQAAREANIKPPAEPPLTHGLSEPNVLEKGKQWGSETPVPLSNGDERQQGEQQQQDGALEATPAGIGEQLRLEAMSTALVESSRFEAMSAALAEQLRAAKRTGNSKYASRSILILHARLQNEAEPIQASGA